MGIHGLTKMLKEEAPDCIKEHEMKNYTGRKVAIDASMCIYQFMVSTVFCEQIIPACAKLLHA